MNKLRLRPKNQDPEKEIQLIEDEYLLLSIEFEARLFASERMEAVTYKSLFDEYAIKWFRWCEQIITKLRYVQPDPNMFYQEYRPAI